MFGSNVIPGLQNIQNLQSLQIPTSQAVVSTPSSGQMANGGDKDEKEDVKPPTLEGSFQGHCGESFLYGVAFLYSMLTMVMGEAPLTYQLFNVFCRHLTCQNYSIN